MKPWFGRLDLLLLALVWLYVALAPFTKVEESFAVQATHDLLYHGRNLDQYDHLDFPGVVPRTFLGPITVATLAAPIVSLAHRLPSLFLEPKLAALYICRMALGLLVTLSFASLRRAVRTVFGPESAAAFGTLLCLQFHLPFYSSRPLPNVFALALTNMALAAWLTRPRERRFAIVAVLAFATVAVRCDVLLLAAGVGLEMLLSGSLGLLEGVGAGLVATALSVGLSVCVDSWFWRRWLWPEGEVLLFNTVENKSHEWGTSPFHWYLTSALPRGLGAGLPLALLGLWMDRRCLRVLLPGVFFVGAYSWLPHKELRFIFPALPLFNVVAAVALARLYINRNKGLGRMLAFLSAAALLALTGTFTLAALTASALNYPGGGAMRLLSRLGPIKGQETTTVHIAVLPAMTGVSRFLEQGKPWAYSKEEGLSPSQLARWGFDYLLTGAGHTDVEGYKVVSAARAFAGFELSVGGERVRLSPKAAAFAMIEAWLRGHRLAIPVPAVRLEPAVFLLRRDGEA